MLARLLGGRAPAAAPAEPARSTTGDATVAADVEGGDGTSTTAAAPSSKSWNVLRRGVVSGTAIKAKRETSMRKANVEDGLIWDSPYSMEYGRYLRMTQLNAVWKSKANHPPVDGTFSYLIRRGPIDDLGAYYGDNVDRERPWFSRDATDTDVWYAPPGPPARPHAPPDDPTPTYTPPPPHTHTRPALPLRLCAGASWPCARSTVAGCWRRRTRTCCAWSCCRPQTPIAGATTP